jgi:hypothetical protein
MTTITGVTMLPPPVIDVIAGGPQGPPGAIGPPGGPVAGWFTPQQFGASGDGVADDSSAVRAAIAAANTAPCGKVYFAPGTYKVTQPLQYYPYTVWEGVPGASIIQLASDLWAGGTNLAATFITPFGGVDSMPHQGPCIMRGLNIYGPSAVTLGQVANKTIGLQTAGHCHYEHLYISRFFAGIQIASNHETFYGCYSTGNYYNVQVKQPSTSGDQSFHACKFDGPGLASLHIESPSALISAIFTKTHAGFGPVGILKTDAQNATSPWDGLGNPNYVGGATSASIPIVGCIFNEWSNEQVGNGAILDISTLGLFAARTRFNALGWIFNNTYKTTKAPLNTADLQGAWGINTRGMDLLTSFDQVTSGFTPGSVGVMKVTGSVLSNPVVNTQALPASFFGSGTNWSSVASGGRFKMDGWPGAVGDALTFPTPGVNPINVGDCVELVMGGATPQVQRATGTKPFFGVALTPTPGGGQAATVAVFVRGIVAINTPTASIPVNTPLFLSSGTPYMVDATSTANPAVGFALQTGSASSVVVALNR